MLRAAASLAVSLVVLFPPPAAPQDSPQAEPPCFPLFDQAEWTYEISGAAENEEKKFTRSLGRGEKKETRSPREPNRTVWPIDNFLPWGILARVTHVEQSPSETSIAFVSPRSQSSYSWVSNSPEPGSGGSSRGQIDLDGETIHDFEIEHKVAGREKIKVPAGEFTCIRIEIRIRAGDETSHLNLWVAPGVGEIQGELTLKRRDEPDLTRGWKLLRHNVATK